MKIYSIVITVVAVILLAVAGYFYQQVAVVKSELATTKSELNQSAVELTNLQNLVATELTSAKATVDILKNSLESFLVAGDVKVASISDSEAKTISDKILAFPDKLNKTSFESGWAGFLKSQTVSDYLAFSRSLAQTLQSNLDNIR